MSTEHRTTGCAAHGHPEITLVTTKRMPVPGIERLLLDYFEEGVAHGTKFLPGQSVQLGWATLRLRSREDGTIGVEEADMEASSGWVESVDRALMATWLQQEVARSVALDGKMEFPRHEQAVTVCKNLLEADAWMLSRSSPTGPGDSGWMFVCAGGDHDHGAVENLTVAQLLPVAWRLPFVTQFLALPESATVLVQGPGRIRATVFLGDDELTPAQGSYLAALAASVAKG